MVDHQNAAKKLEIAAKLDPNNSEVQYQLAQAYGPLRLREQQQEAMARFNALKEESKENPGIHANGPSPLLDAEASAQAGKFEEAIEYAKKALSLDPVNDRVIFLLASLYYDAGQLDSARQNVDEALAKAPSEWTYHYLLGLIAERNGQWAEEKESVETALRLNPRCAECYDHLGALAMQTHQPQVAVEDFAQAVQLEPANAEYKSHFQDAQHAVQQ